MSKRLPAKLARPESPIADIKVPAERKRPLGDVRRLADSIQQIGLQNAITVTADGVLVSGLHRLEACRSLGWESIPVFVVQLDELHRELAEIDENLIRNELTVLERSEHLQRRMQIYEALHPETRNVNVRGGPGRGKKTNAESASVLPTFTEDTATKTGRSQRVVQEEVQIAKSLDDETKAAVRGTPLEDSKTDLLELAREKDVQKRLAIVDKIGFGHASSVKEARRHLKLEAREQARQDILAAARASNDFGTIDLCPIESVADMVDPESVDMVFTDPPWHDEHVELYSQLAEVAAHALKPGGMCLVYAGKMYLPEIITGLAKRLEYVWQFVVFHPFSQTRSNSRAIFENYRPILVFRKPGPQEHASKRAWVQDVVRGRREKDHHEWQQDEDAPRAYIDAYTVPGGIVLDPFSGGGTTAAVCKALGRRFICFDADEQAVKATLARVASVVSPTNQGLDLVEAAS